MSGETQCFASIQVVYTTKKRRNALRLYRGGTDGNRTSDTRIFSPLLYQLSYGTSVLRLQKYCFFLYWQEKNAEKEQFFCFEKCFSL